TRSIAEGDLPRTTVNARPARMPSARRLRPQPTESLAGSCPASFVHLASVSALAAFGSFPCLSYHPCLPSPGSLLAIMARGGECVASQVFLGGMIARTPSLCTG